MMTLIMATPTNHKETSSFRDPAGFIFSHNGEIYRQINEIYHDNFDLLLSSGLYEQLTKKRKLVSHKEVDSPLLNQQSEYKTIKPEKIKFISYPYEWSFSQFKDAALLTLNIEKESLHFGMSLKDASAYNIQFQDGHPILIDTLSFTKYIPGEPWIAYKQFCQHFLAPLALMSRTDIRFNHMLKDNIDGIPLDLTSKLLPLSTKLNFGLLTHIHLHAYAQKRYPSDEALNQKTKTTMSFNSRVGLIENLEKTIKKMAWKPFGTDWLNYYESTNYSDSAFQEKKRIIGELLFELKPERLLDLGANTGIFSRQGKDIENCYIVSTDIDPGAVEVNYLEVRKSKEKNLLPLVIDFVNPSPAIGWKNQERKSFLERAKPDVILALALIHHLAITNNIPLKEISELFAQMGRIIIIEFVPKSDSQVQRLLVTRDDIFPDYSIEGFIDSVQERFLITKQIPIAHSDRVIFLLRKKVE